MEKCKHKRIKRNFPFGRESKAIMYCKICGGVIKGKDLEEIRERKKKQERQGGEK